MSHPRRIDVHHHMVPASYAQWLRDRGLAAGERYPAAMMASVNR